MPMNRLALYVRAALWWLLPLAALAAIIGWETEWGRAVQPASAAAGTDRAAAGRRGAASRIRDRRRHGGAHRDGRADALQSDPPPGAVRCTGDHARR